MRNFLRGYESLGIFARMEKEYYSPEEAASLLGVTRRTIYTWLKTGKLPARQFGRTWRIHRSEVQPPQRKEAA